MHLRHLGHPIANDPLYATDSAAAGDVARAGVAAWSELDGAVTPALAAAALQLQSGWEERQLGLRLGELRAAAARGDQQCQQQLEQLRLLVRLDPGSCGPGGASSLRRLFSEEQLRCRGIWLHAWTYSGPGWHYEVPPPAWAAAPPGAVRCGGCDDPESGGGGPGSGSDAGQGS